MICICGDLSADCNTTEDKSPSFIGINSNKFKIKNEKRHIPSASTALIIGGILGLIQTIFLIFGAKPLLSVMGVKSVSVCKRLHIVRCFFTSELLFIVVLICLKLLFDVYDSISALLQKASIIICNF